MSQTLPACSKTPSYSRSDRSELTDYEAYRSGDDWGPALAQACRESRHIHIPKGSYLMGEVRIPSGTVIEGDGDATVIVPKGKFMFRIEGYAGKEVNVTENIADFSDAITVSDGSVFKEGDMVQLQSQRNCMFREDCGEWTLGQTTAKNKTCFFGEILELKSVSGNVLTTSTRTIFPYYRSDSSQETVKPGFQTRKTSTLMKIDAVRDVEVRSVLIRCGSTCTMPVRIKYASRCRVENTTVSVEEDFADESANLFMILNSTECRFSGCRSVYSDALVKKKQKELVPAYSIYSLCNNFKIVSSDRCSIENCRDNFATHAFTISYSDGGIPSAHCSIKGCVSDNSIWAGVISQQCTPWSELSGNIVRGASQGVLAGSRWSRITDNTVSTDLPFSTNFYYAHISRGGTTGIAVFEGYGRECELSGNRISGFFSGIKVLDGYESHNIFDGKSDISISGNEVSGCIYGFMFSRNKYNTGTEDLGIRICDNVFSAAGETVLADGERNSAGLNLCGAAGIIPSGNIFSGFHDACIP